MVSDGWLVADSHPKAVSQFSRIPLFRLVQNTVACLHNIGVDHTQALRVGTCHRLRTQAKILIPAESYFSNFSINRSCLLYIMKECNSKLHLM